MKNILFLSLLLCILSFTIFSQTVYKKYTNTTANFSLQLPQNWVVLNDTKAENNIAICVPTLDKEKKEYANCFEGTIFYIEKYKSDLNTTLKNKDYIISNDSIFTSDRISDKVVVTKIQKNNYKGIYHQNVCGISCNDGTGFHAVAGKCDYLYFSLGSKTICIYTTGKALSPSVIKNIIATFKFI